MDVLLLDAGLVPEIGDFDRGEAAVRLLVVGVNAKQEQASGIEQLNIAIADIDHGTQQNAAMVQQGACATELLSQQTQALEQSVATLHLGPEDLNRSSSAAAHELSTSIVQTNPKSDKKSSFRIAESFVPDNDHDWSKF